MASMSITHCSFLSRNCTWNTVGIAFTNKYSVGCKVKNKSLLVTASRRKITDESLHEASNGEVGSVGKKTRKRAPARTQKGEVEIPSEDSTVNGHVRDEQVSADSAAISETKPRRRTRRKASSSSETLEKETVEKPTRRRRTKKKADVIDDSQGNETEVSDHEEDKFSPASDEDSEQELELDIVDGEDISFTYGWPPLVCCFGTAQHAFVPCGRRANRLIDYEMHERMRDALWEPEKFVRASGGCSSNVAIALASLGGKVAFMGKLGDDDFGQSLLYNLNSNNVQTRSVCIDGKKATSISHMKVGKRGSLRMSSVKPFAEDSLSKSDINVDVLKEAKMFYFNTFSLLERNMRLTTLQAIKLAKRLGNVIFYDLNLPLPLWRSTEETKTFVQSVWELSDIVEVTKQELEFLCGIAPSEPFDTRDNSKSKFTHYPPEVVSLLWHENLKVLFVTNGTSKMHYYTKEHNGCIHGMEDAPLSPYTSDMSASGDGFIAGVLRMLTVQPHLILDKAYLERSIRYGISCGVIDQWLQARRLGFPAKEGMEDVEADPYGIRSITEREYRTLVPSKLLQDQEHTYTLFVFDGSISTELFLSDFLLLHGCC